MGFKEIPQKTTDVGKKIAVGGILGVVAGSLLNLNRLFGLGANVTGLGAVVWGTGKALQHVMS